MEKEFTHLEFMLVDNLLHRLQRNVYSAGVQRGAEEWRRAEACPTRYASIYLSIFIRLKGGSSPRSPHINGACLHGHQTVKQTDNIQHADHARQGAAPPDRGTDERELARCHVKRAGGLNSRPRAFRAQQIVLG